MLSAPSGGCGLRLLLLLEPKTPGYRFQAQTIFRTLPIKHGRQESKTPKTTGRVMMPCE
jgi:hypothetical protein